MLRVTGLQPANPDSVTLLLLAALACALEVLFSFPLRSDAFLCSRLSTVHPAALPLQEAIYPQSTVMATFCCDAENKQDVQVSFRVIFSYDYKGMGTIPSNPPPSP